MYSALKVGGKKLYELAREGKTVERKARPVQIHSIEIMEIDLPRVTMEVSCSKGTYIRTLCHDIGEKLGCGACMESLLRTKVSRFELEDSLTLGEIEKKKQDGTLMEAIIPIDAMFPECRSVDVKEAGNQYLYNGNPFSLSFVKKERSMSRKNGCGCTMRRECLSEFIATVRRKRCSGSRRCSTKSKISQYG